MRIPLLHNNNWKTKSMNNKYKYYLISGPILALGLMFGAAIGANVGNIKIGIAFGILVGVLISTLAIFLAVYRHKQNNQVTSGKYE